MTHQDQPTALDRIAELLAEHGFDGLAQAVTVLLNEVMKLERSAALGAVPYERSEGRTGYANGFKPRTIHTRIGPLAVEVPQTRGVEFYPSALEKGVRSERALKLAVAEMYVRGVSTREVAAITEQLCGLEVTSSQVSRAAQALDADRLASCARMYSMIASSVTTPELATGTPLALRYPSLIVQKSARSCTACPIEER